MDNLEYKLNDLSQKAKQQQEKNKYSTTQVLLKNIVKLRKELHERSSDIDKKLVEKTIEQIEDIYDDLQENLE